MDALARARQKRAELVEQLAKLDSFITLGEELGLGGGGTDAAAAKSSGAGIRLRQRPVLASSIVSLTVRAAKEAIEAAGHPLSTAVLLDRVREMGVEVGGQVPSSTLSARLSNSNVLTNHKGLGWWVTDKELPPNLGVFQ